MPDVYPLTSTDLPDAAKVQSVIAGLPSGLPTDACCAVVKQVGVQGLCAQGARAQSERRAGLASWLRMMRGRTAALRVHDLDGLAPLSRRLVFWPVQAQACLPGRPLLPPTPHHTPPAPHTPQPPCSLTPPAAAARGPWPLR